MPTNKIRQNLGLKQVKEKWIKATLNAFEDRIFYLSQNGVVEKLRLQQ